MISLTSEMTDSKGRHARGWLFYDAECGFCTRTAMRLVGALSRRGLAVAPLQDPRVSALLGLPRQELLQAIRFVSEDGHHCAGADAIVALAREFWWAHPLVWLAKLPGMMVILSAAYQHVAMRRSCTAEQCGIKRGNG